MEKEETRKEEQNQPQRSSLDDWQGDRVETRKEGSVERSTDSVKQPSPPVSHRASSEKNPPSESPQVQEGVLSPALDQNTENHDRDRSPTQRPEAKHVEGESPLLPPTYSISQIIATAYPDPVWVIHKLLPEGLAVLAGKPKTGKSTFALDLAISVANGQKVFDQFDVTPQGVLYEALEDTPRRLQKRLLPRLNGRSPSGRVQFGFQWPKTDQGGIKYLDKWLEEHPDVKLVIIDTLARFRGINRPGRTQYEADYEELSQLKEIADKHHITILVLHHLRKTDSNDVLDMISGSVGITAAADTIIIMQRGRGQVDSQLSFTGRDIEDTDLALQFEGETRSFKFMGKTEEYEMSPERREILELLRNSDDPLQLKDIAEKIDKKKTTVLKLLGGLMDDRFVEKTSYGKYVIKPEEQNDDGDEESSSGELSESGESCENCESDESGESGESGEPSPYTSDEDISQSNKKSTGAHS